MFMLVQEILGKIDDDLKILLLILVLFFAFIGVSAAYMIQEFKYSFRFSQMNEELEEMKKELRNK
ncbi:MAG: hypothetical protein J6K88_05955 [Oscillospiraceae bacterium]|nr:hypothetical protein [Oscillospiraceae bacterium]